ncbi:MAG: type II toxin-antitoxin system PemK/MazF family toxin [Chloroflexota bacterium]|nr:type II toxin-antitoxin system PemK/MazF family toxin [Chloroflexota bacterium]
MTGGEIWLAQVGRKRRPVLVLTRPEVIEVRELITVAEVTTSIRNIAAEGDFDQREAGLDRPSVINCDGLHTIPKASLTNQAGSVSEETMERVCAAVGYALGC